jgi:Carboxypeptidase regulatory-like domain
MIGLNLRGVKGAWISVLSFALTTAVPAASHATLSGVVLGTDHFPIAYATIVAIGTKQGALADSLGRFQFRELAPGSYDLRIAALGHDSVTRRVSFDSSSPPCTLMVNGPGLRKQAPFRSIPDGMVQALERADSGQSFRLDPDRGIYGKEDRDDAQARIGPLRFLSRGSDLSREEAMHVGALLSNEDHYVHRLEGVRKLCIPRYRHGLRLFTTAGDTIECYVCLTCGVLGLVLDEGKETWVVTSTRWARK